jgi:hypothetical protein
VKLDQTQSCRSIIRRPFFIARAAKKAQPPKSDLQDSGDVHDLPDTASVNSIASDQSSKFAITARAVNEAVRAAEAAKARAEDPEVSEDELSLPARSDTSLSSRGSLSRQGGGKGAEEAPETEETME